MDLKSVLSEEEYKVYIKSEMLKEISNNNYQGIYDLLIDNKLVNSSNDESPVIEKINNNSNAEDLLKELGLKPQQTNNSKKFVDNENFKKTLCKTEENIKNKFSYLLRDICNSARIHNKNYKIDDKIVAFYSKGHFYVTLRYYKEFFNSSGRIRWDREFGEHWESSHYIRPKIMSNSIVPYSTEYITMPNGVETHSCFKMRNDMLEELGYYNDLVGVHSDYR